jgi:hypothetical protein
MPVGQGARNNIILGGLGRPNLFDTNVKATSIDEDIFTDQEVITSPADGDLVLVLDVSETPDKIKYITRSNFIGEGLVSITGNVDNRIMTATGSQLSGEANLLFDGTILTNDGGEVNIDIASGDPHLSFQIGGTDEFTIGVDDSDSDSLKIDTGGTVGGATKLTLDTSGNVTLAGGLTVTGDILPAADDTHDIGSASAAFQDLFLEGDITLTDAGTIATSAGDLTVDAEGDIILDANGANITFKDDGTSILDIVNSSTDVEVTVSTADKNLKFKGTDGSSAITALDIDMAAAGAATFNGDVTVGALLKMPSNTSSNILVADGTSFEEVAVGDLAEISSIANDDVFLAVDTSGGGLKKVSRSQVVSGLAASGAITDVVDDSSPQLGGNLDMNGNDIVTTSNASIDLAPNGTGTVVIRGNDNQGTLTLNCENNSHGQKIKAAPHSESASNTLTLPSTGGDARLVSTSSTATLTNKSFGDNIDIFEDANNADVTVRMGTSATEALKIEVLNGGSNKTAESVAFTSATASSTGDHGQFTFSVDEATAMLTIDDGGISIAASGAYEVNGTAILSDSSGTMTLSNVDALDATTESTIESAIDTLSNLTTTGALNSGSITSGFGNIDVGSSTIDTTGAVGTGALTAGGILKTDDATDATSTTDGSLQTDGGLSVAKDGVIGNDLLMLSDSSVIKFGANSEVTLTHDHNVGLALKHTATADDKPIILTLQTGETDMAANDVIGAVRFQAPDEGTGTDAILTAAAIQAVSEGDFAADANATKLEFHTAVSEAASSKMTLSSAGNLTVAGDLTITGDDLFMNTNTAGHILVGDDTNYNPVAVSGDIGLASNGAMTIQAGAVEHGMLADDIISGQAEITTGLAAADELMYSDAGTVKRIGVDTLATKLFSVASAGTVAQASDHMLFLDNGATGDVIVESIDDFLNAIAGANVSVSSSQLTVASASATALDDIATGDAASNLVTTTGNITLDAQANDADVIIKVDDNGSSVTAVTFDGSDEGNAIFVNDIQLKSDDSIIKFGADLDVSIIHDPDDGLFFKSAATGDNNPFVLTLQTGETDIAADDVIGALNFQAPDEGTGTDAILVAAGIEAVSEGDFSSSNNATKLSFKTGASEAAAEKMSLSSVGLLTIADDFMIKDGGTIGVASANDAMTIASTGIVTFKDDILIKDGGTIGVASAATAITIASTGIVTFADDIIIKDAGTIGSASDTDAISISSGGVVNISATTANTGTGDGALTVAGGMGVAADVSIGDDLRLISDSAVLSFGANSEVTMTHVHDVGLTVTNTIADTDNRPVVLQLKSEEDAIVADDVIGSIEIAAGDSDGTDGATVAAGIHAIAENTFSASANPTKLVFTAGVSETAASSATAKMTLSSAGLLTITDDFVIKDGGTIGVASAADAMTISSGGIVTFKDDIIIKDGGTIGSASDTDAISISSGGVVAISATTANSDASDGALTVAGGASVAADLTVGDDLRLLSDSAVLSFGADGDSTITHADDAGLTFNSTSTFADVVLADDKTVTLGEAGKIDFGDSDPDDNEATGIIFSMTASETLAVGDVVFLHTDGKVKKADMNAVTTMPAIGIITTGGSADATVDVMVQGVMHDASAFPTFSTLGADVFVSSTGDITATAPSGSGDTVQKIGVALHGDKVYFNFNTTEVLLA